MAGEKRKPQAVEQPADAPEPEVVPVQPASPEGPPEVPPEAPREQAAAEPPREPPQAPPQELTPEQASVAARAAAAHAKARSSSEPITSAFAILWGAFLAGAVVYNTYDAAQRFIDDNVLLVGLAALFLAAMPFVPKVGDWFRIAPATKQAAVIIFIVIPLIVFLMAGILLFDDHIRVPAIRMVFLFTVTLFPALLYYLFIAARRDSLLNEFIGNLDRLGLLNRQAVATRARPAEATTPDAVAISAAEPDRLAWSIESDESRDLRIRTYLERFEAIYGRLPDGLIGRILTVTDEKNEDSERKKLFQDRFEWSNIFSTETTLPVIGATALIALGWVVTLPPVFATLESQQPTGWAVERLFLVEPAAAVAEVSVEDGAGGAASGATAKADATWTIPWSGAIEPIGAMPVHFAFLGAYFFSLQMLFRRFVRRDLGPNAYLGVALRIVLAVVGVWVAMVALEALDLEDSLGLTGTLTVAFAVGAFPVIVWKLVSAVTKKVPGMAVALPSLKSDLPLSKLSGLTIWHETRLEEEDVENVQNMATADIVDLMLHTRFPPDRIIAWVDEAMLYVHLGAEEVSAEQGFFTTKLRPRGIRNASTLVAAYERAKARGEEADFFAMAEGKPNRLRVMLDTIATNPNLALVERWRGLLFPSLSGPRG